MRALARGLLLGAFCALVATAYWQMRPSVPLPGADRLASGLDNSAANTGGPVSARNAASSTTPRAISAEMSVRLARRSEIDAGRERRADELTFVRSLLPAARAGDAEAQRAIADALASCEWWERTGSDGKSWRQRIQDPTRHSLHWAEIRADVEKRLAQCEPLNAASEDEVGSYGEWMDRAAASGDGQALLARAHLAEGRTADDQVEDFHHAVTTGDPAVLRSIVAGYAYQSDGFSWRLMPSGERLTQMELLNASLDLVDCSLTQDCSAPSAQQNCGTWSFIYDCGYASDVRSYYELRLSRQDFAKADQYAQILVAEFLSGGFDWPEARAYEDALRNPPTERAAVP